MPTRSSRSGGSCSTWSAAVPRGDQWLDSIDARPDIVGEFEDSELLWEFGAGGDGIFPVPTVLEKHVMRLHGVKLVGRTDGARGRYYAISVERRLKHPAVVAICETARRKLFRVD